MRWPAALVGAALLVAGCSAGMDDSAAPTSGDTDRAEEDEGGMAAEQSADDAGADEAADSASDGELGSGADDVVTFGGTGEAVTGRQLARTASIVLEVGDVEQAASRVSGAAQRAGGFVSGAEVRGGDFGSGFLTLRVPARALDATVEDLAEIGERVVESSISTEDLTDRLTDLQARIDNLERLEAELQGLLADVRDNDPQATQLLQVFERLNQVRGEIERLEASRAAARDRVDLATINVELLPRSVAPEGVEPAPEGTLAQAWQTTKEAFGAIGDALIWLGVTVLPVTLVLLGIPALLVWALLRWRRQRRQAPPSPPRAAELRDGTPRPPDGSDAAAPPPRSADETSEAPETTQGDREPADA